MTIFGHACLSRATSGGSTSAPTTSLAATRTTPRSSALSRLKLAAVRSSARAVLSIASACTRSASAASVASRPVCERVNKAWPRAFSSPAIWRPAVG